MKIKKTDIKIKVAIKLGISTIGVNSVISLKGQNHSQKIEDRKATPISIKKEKNAKWK